MTSEWVVVDQCSLSDVYVDVLKSEQVEGMIIIRFEGELFTEYVQSIFTSIANPSGKWLGNQKTGNVVVLDLYNLEYINSLTIGYFANIYNTLHSKQIELTFIISKKGLIKEVLEQVGFLKFPGVKVYWERNYIESK